MAWITPIINWIASNAVTPTDFNRIEGNTLDLYTNKVDKITGKSLSESDYTAIEKTKLGGIASSANNYVHPSTHPYSIISNPPTIPTLTSQLTNNSGFLTLQSSVTGAYTGNGAASRTISIGFTPSGVYVNDTSLPFSRTGGLAISGNNVIGGDNVIAVGITTNGFNVSYRNTGSSSDVRTNTSGVVYTYVAFR